MTDETKPEHWLEAAMLGAEAGQEFIKAALRGPMSIIPGCEPPMHVHEAVGAMMTSDDMTLRMAAFGVVVMAASTNVPHSRTQAFARGVLKTFAAEYAQAFAQSRLDQTKQETMQ